MNRKWLLHGMGALLMTASFVIGCACPGSYPGGTYQGAPSGGGMVSPGIGGSGSSYAPPTYSPPSSPNPVPQGSGMR